MSVPKIKVDGQVVDLNQNNYKAAGGEGTIYVKGGTAFKIYHDPDVKMIAPGKIRELARLTMPNVLGPQKIVTDIRDKPIGFTMRYVDKTEYLCKLFTRGFRDDNRIDPAMINALVKRMQDTLKGIHALDTLVVDYNELNFLTDKKFGEVYHIDVDCYKTPSYPATAIMASIQDPQVKNNKWSEMSDWYSAAIIFCQLYLGTHPYKGRHPDYGKDWQARMKAGVSIFNKAATMPPNTQDLSVVPKGHLKWFEKVLEHGERCAPPEPDQVLATAGQVVPQIVSGTDKFALTLIRKYDGNIQNIRWIGGAAYTYTEKGIYANERLLRALTPTTGFTAQRISRDFVPVQNDSPALLEFSSLTDEMRWNTFDGRYGGKFEASAYFIANERLYVVNNSNLVEYSFMNLGAKPIAAQQIVGNVVAAHQTFDGMVVEDILGTCRFLIPIKAGVAKSVKVATLDKVRITSAKYQRGIAIVVGEQKGILKRWTFSFDKDINTFTERVEEGVSAQDVQFVVLDKGICVAANEDTIEIFANNNKVKMVDDSPIVNNQRLVSFGNDIFLINRNELHQLKTK